jgi:uncharacterized coiled-coil DUF342 family protein
MKTPEEIKQASSQYADLIKHMDDLHTEACQLDFQAGANWMKDQSTSQIEDLTKENEELSKENDELHNSLLQRTDQNIDLTKEVESKKESIRILMKQLDTQQESNDRYREALEGLHKEAYDLREKCSDMDWIDFSDNDIEGVDLFNKALHKAHRSLHPLVKEGEKEEYVRIA